MTPTAEQWTGLAILTESAQPHEWWPIAWTIRNRIESKHYPNTAEAVVLQPSQFSRFRDWRLELTEGGPQAVWDTAMAWVSKDKNETRLKAATACAAEVLSAMPWHRPFSAATVFYYSPQSMIPPMSKPVWWDSEVLCDVTPAGINPVRFRFGEAKRG